MIFFRVNKNPILTRRAESNINHKNQENDHQLQLKNSVSIYHQNICGLKNKTNDLISFLYSKLRSLMCINEHHLKLEKLQLPHPDYYNLGAYYCRQYINMGGGSIFVQKEIKFEACAIKIKSSLSSTYIICIYRAPSGNFELFMEGMENIIKKMCKIGLKMVICGDMHIDYLTENEMKIQLDTMLLSYNLHSLVNFHTRAQKHSSSAIDNIFLNPSQFNNYVITPMFNGLFDHDAQLLTLNEMKPQKLLLFENY
jgi:hypothetical protein